MLHITCHATARTALVLIFVSAATGAGLAEECIPGRVFDLERLLITGGNTELRVVDFDADGDLDIVGTSRDSVTLLLREPGAPDVLPAFFAAGGDASAVTVADLNGDGLPDAVAGLGNDDGVSVLLNDGSGGLGAPAFFAAPGSIFCIESGDVDDDGDLDILANDLTNDQVVVYTNDEAGSLTQAGTVSVGAASNEISLADLDGDGDLDLVAGVNTSASIVVAYNDGNGSFAPGPPLAGVHGCGDTVLGDVDGDGDLDATVVCGFNGEIRVFLNDGGGNFNSFLSGGALPPSADDGTLVDVNNDGVLDLAGISGLNTAPPFVAIGHGDGTFGPVETYATGQVSNGPVPDDFNSDGIVDLLFWNSDSSVILYGRGDGTFIDHDIAASNPHASGVIAGDFNGDGRVDAATIEEFGQTTFGNRVGIMLRGPAGFQAPVFHTVGDRIIAAVTADFDDDGALDIATLNESSQDASVLLGNGDGTFQPKIRIALGEPVGDIGAGDFDHDGDDDLAVVLPRSSEVRGVVQVFLSDGAGGFAAATEYVLGGVSSFLAVDDVDGDGTLDLAVGSAEFNGTTQDLRLIRGNGDGTFGFREIISVGGERMQSFVLADVDGDGDPDLVTSDGFNDAGCVRLNPGDGVFGVPICVDASLPFDYGSPDIVRTHPFDLDGEHWLDLAVIDQDNGIVVVYASDGMGGYAFRGRYEAGLTPDGLASADFDGDGDHDLLIATQQVGVYSLANGCGTGEVCPADLAIPFGVLDLADIQAFVTAFLSSDTAADLAEPAGVFDLADLQAFIAAFAAGCP